MFYNTDFGVPVYCNGTDWKAAAPLNPTAGGAGCTGPAGAEGQVIYNDDNHVLQYCDGDEWIAMGASPPLIETEPAIGVGAAHSCGVRTDGVAMCWGAALNGRLGNGTTRQASSRPSSLMQARARSMLWAANRAINAFPRSRSLHDNRIFGTLLHLNRPN